MKHGYFKIVAVRVPGTGTGTAPVRQNRTGYGKKVSGTFDLYGYVSGTSSVRHGYGMGTAPVRQGLIYYFLKLK